MAKKSLDELIAEFEKLAEAEKKEKVQQAKDSAEISAIKETRKKEYKAKKLESKKTPKEKSLDKMKKETDEAKIIDDYNKIVQKKPEQISGAEAVDKLLDSYAKAYKRVYDDENQIKPEFASGVSPEKQIIRGRKSIPLPRTDLYSIGREKGLRSAKVIPVPFMKTEFEVDNPFYDPKGKKGSRLRIANERIDDIRDELDLAQTAKEKGISIQEAKRNKEIQDKFAEYLKKFNVPAFGTFDGKQIIADKEKLEAKKRYLAKIQTQNFFRK